MSRLKFIKLQAVNYKHKNKHGRTVLLFDTCGHTCMPQSWLVGKSCLNFVSVYFFLQCYFGDMKDNGSENIEDYKYYSPKEIDYSHNDTNHEQISGISSLSIYNTDISCCTPSLSRPFGEYCRVFYIWQICTPDCHNILASHISHYRFTFAGILGTWCIWGIYRGQNNISWKTVLYYFS